MEERADRYRNESRHDPEVPNREQNRRNRGPRARSRSPTSHRERDDMLTKREFSNSPQALVRSSRSLPSQNRAYQNEGGSKPSIKKEKPNWKPTGKLATASNTVQTAGQTIVMKYNEPDEAKKPSSKDKWRMYVFENNDIVDTIELWQQSSWLIGRELAVCDISDDHASCSKQHAVLQFRYIERRNEFGDKIGKVKPYIIDLESSHGTLVNEDRVPEAKYVELKDKDMITLGNSQREYVLQLPRD